MVVFMSTTPRTGCDKERLLGCLSEVETGNNDQAVSSSGAVSRYQIMPYNWKYWTGFPISHATDPAISTHVASLVLDGFQREIKNSPGVDMSEDVYTLAIVWYTGADAWRTNQLEPDAIDFAERVENLYNDKTYVPKYHKITSHR